MVLRLGALLLLSTASALVPDPGVTSVAASPTVAKGTKIYVQTTNELKSGGKIEKEG